MKKTPIETFKISNELISKKKDDGSIIIVKLSDDESYVQIEGYCCKIWEMLEKGKDEPQILKQITKDYPDQEEEAVKLFKKFIKDLKKNKIIVDTSQSKT